MNWLHQNITNIIVLAMVGLLIVICIRSLLTDKKKGGCAGCNGGCASCSMGCTCALGSIKKG